MKDARIASFKAIHILFVKGGELIQIWVKYRLAERKTGFATQQLIFQLISFKVELSTSAIKASLATEDPYFTPDQPHILDWGFPDNWPSSSSPQWVFRVSAILPWVYLRNAIYLFGQGWKWKFRTTAYNHSAYTKLWLTQSTLWSLARSYNSWNLSFASLLPLTYLYVCSVHAEFLIPWLWQEEVPPFLYCRLWKYYTCFGGWD